MPLIMKLYFAFVVLLAVSMIGLIIAIGVYSVDDPGSIGRFFGEIASGYEETVDAR